MYMMYFHDTLSERCPFERISYSVSMNKTLSWVPFSHTIVLSRSLFINQVCMCIPWLTPCPIFPSVFVSKTQKRALYPCFLPPIKMAVSVTGAPGGSLMHRLGSSRTHWQMCPYIYVYIWCLTLTVTPSFFDGRIFVPWHISPGFHWHIHMCPYLYIYIYVW